MNVRGKSARYQPDAVLCDHSRSVRETGWDAWTRNGFVLRFAIRVFAVEAETAPRLLVPCRKPRARSCPSPSGQCAAGFRREGPASKAPRVREGRRCQFDFHYPDRRMEFRLDLKGAEALAIWFTNGRSYTGSLWRPRAISAPVRVEPEAPTLRYAGTLA